MSADLYEADHNKLDLLEKSEVDVLRVVHGLIDSKLGKSRGYLAKDLINGIVVAFDRLRDVENEAEGRARDVSCYRGDRDLVICKS